MTHPLDLDQVALDELAQLLDSQDYPAGYLEPATGELIHTFEGAVFGPDGDPVDLDETDLVAVEGEGSRPAYRDMEIFAAHVAHRSIRIRLEGALHGRGAFRRFREVMWDAPEELGEAWNRYRNLGAERRAVRWLRDVGLVDEGATNAAEASITDTMDSILIEIEGRRPSTVVDLAEELTHVSEHWSPSVVARLNDYEVKVVKVQGEFVWHSHDDTDELFLVVDGSLTIQLRADGGEESVTVGAGQLYVVPQGVEHRPVAAGEVSAVLIEPTGVVNTGDADPDLTTP